MAAKQELWNEYRATWDAFAQALGEYQHLMESGSPESSEFRSSREAAFLSVETARLAHNAARDRLAAYLTRKMPGCLPEISEELRVRKAARRLWEFSGRPHGTAEKDWLNAERMVRSAGAC